MSSPVVHAVAIEQEGSKAAASSDGKKRRNTLVLLATLLCVLLSAALIVGLVVGLRHKSASTSSSSNGPAGVTVKVSPLGSALTHLSAGRRRRRLLSVPLDSAYLKSTTCSAWAQVSRVGVGTCCSASAPSGVPSDVGSREASGLVGRGASLCAFWRALWRPCQHSGPAHGMWATRCAQACGRLVLMLWVFRRVDQNTLARSSADASFQVDHITLHLGFVAFTGENVGDQLVSTQWGTSQPLLIGPGGPVSVNVSDAVRAALNGSSAVNASLANGTLVNDAGATSVTGSVGYTGNGSFASAELLFWNRWEIKAFCLTANSFVRTLYV